MKESIVLCEGYHDRAFWAAMLEHLGCQDPGIQPGKGSRKAVYDPWDKKVQAGQYAFHTPTGRFVRIVPCNGKSNILREMRSRLREEQTLASASTDRLKLKRLVVGLDTDLNADSESEKTGLQLPHLLAKVREFDADAEETGETEISLFKNRLHVSLALWEVAQAPDEGVPTQQTLERLVCAALAAAYSDRAQAVQQWLDSRPDPPSPSVKEYSWSYMAGWFPESGPEFFFRHIWIDAKVLEELRARLSACGVWQIAEELAR